MLIGLHEILFKSKQKRHYLESRINIYNIKNVPYDASNHISLSYVQKLAYHTKICIQDVLRRLVR